MLSVKNIREKKKRAQPKAMVSEHLDPLVTKAGINTQAMETIARLEISKFSLQTTVLKVRFRDASHLTSSHLISSNLHTGISRERHELSPAEDAAPVPHSDATWVPLSPEL